jgi:hypothetical protein
VLLRGGLGGGFVRLDAYTLLQFADRAVVSAAGDPGTSNFSIGSGGGGGGTIELVGLMIRGTAQLDVRGGSASGTGGGGTAGLIKIRPQQSAMFNPTYFTVGGAGQTSDCTGAMANQQVLPLPQDRKLPFCRQGTFANTIQSGGCAQCPPGTGTNSPGNNFCPNCTKGFFSNSFTEGLCIACAEGLTSDDGATECITPPMTQPTMSITTGTSISMMANMTSTPESSWTLPRIDSANSESDVSATTNDDMQSVSNSVISEALDIAMIAGIAGGVGGALLLAALIACAVVLSKRRRPTSDDGTNISTMAASTPVSQRTHEYGMLPPNNSSLGGYDDVNSVRPPQMQ